MLQKEGQNKEKKSYLSCQSPVDVGIPALAWIQPQCVELLEGADPNVVRVLGIRIEQSNQRHSNISVNAGSSIRRIDIADKEGQCERRADDCGPEASSAGSCRRCRRDTSSCIQTEPQKCVLAG